MHFADNEIDISYMTWSNGQRQMCIDHRLTGKTVSALIPDNVPEEQFKIELMERLRDIISGKLQFSQEDIRIEHFNYGGGKGSLRIIHIPTEKSVHSECGDAPIDRLKAELMDRLFVIVKDRGSEDGE